jgi:hypothetical protein
MRPSATTREAAGKGHRLLGAAQRCGDPGPRAVATVDSFDAPCMPDIHAVHEARRPPGSRHDHDASVLSDMAGFLASVCSGGLGEREHGADAGAQDAVGEAVIDRVRGVGEFGGASTRSSSPTSSTRSSSTQTARRPTSSTPRCWTTSDRALTSPLSASFTVLGGATLREIRLPSSKCRLEEAWRASRSSPR